MLLHTDAIAQNCAARVWASRIDGDDSHCAVLFSIITSQMVHQRALARPRGARDSQNARVPAIWKQGFEEFGPSKRAILDRTDRLRQCARIACAQMLYPTLYVLIQSNQCKGGALLL